MIPTFIAKPKFLCSMQSKYYCIQILGPNNSIGSEALLNNTEEIEVVRLANKMPKQRCTSRATVRLYSELVGNGRTLSVPLVL